MPDRRQSDRRETSKLQKKLSISLGTFISIVVIFIISIVAFIACISFRFAGYQEGHKDGYDLAYDKGYTIGYSEGYNAAYNGYDYYGDSAEYEDIYEDEILDEAE